MVLPPQSGIKVALQSPDYITTNPKAFIIYIEYFI